MKKTGEIKSFRLEDRVLFEAAAVAQIIEAVDNQEAVNQDQNVQEQHTEQQEESKSIAQVQSDESYIDVSNNDVSSDNVVVENSDDVYESLLDGPVFSTVGDFIESVSNDLVQDVVQDVFQDASLVSDFAQDDLSVNMSNDTISHDDLFNSIDSIDSIDVSNDDSDLTPDYSVNADDNDLNQDYNFSDHNDNVDYDYSVNGDDSDSNQDYNFGDQHDDLDNNYSVNGDNSDSSYDYNYDDNDNELEYSVHVDGSDYSYDYSYDDNDNELDYSDSIDYTDNYGYELPNGLETLGMQDGVLEVNDHGESLTVASNHELFVVSSTLPDSDQLLAQLNAELAPNAEILVLDGQGGALDSIKEYLNSADVSYSAIHIVSHGDAGELWLNGEKIDASNVNAEDWANIGNHLTENGDILFYGCGIAQTEAGRELLQTIANASGADILASEDTTGIHGNWDLEYSIGKVDTTAISIDAYEYDLEANCHITVTQCGDKNDGFNKNGTSLREAVLYMIDHANEHESFTIEFDSDVFSSESSRIITLNSTLNLTSANLSGKLVTINGSLGDDQHIELVASNTNNKFVSILTASDDTSTYKLSLEHISLTGKGLNNHCRVMDLKGSDIELTLNDVTISNTYVLDNGSGISAVATNDIIFTMTNSSLHDNTALGEGGGVYIKAGNDAIVTLNNSEIHDNSSASMNGGGIYITAGHDTEVTLNSSKVYNNYAFSNGGGIYITARHDLASLYSDNPILGNNATLILNDSEIHNNKACDNGGGVYIEAYNNVTLKTEGGASKIYNNEAYLESGGGVYIASAKNVNVDLKSIEISGNTARGDGGGLYVDGEQSSSINLEDVTFSNNMAVNGGAIFSNGSNAILTIKDSNFVENHSINDGGALCVQDGSINITNSVFDRNEAGYEQWVEYKNPYFNPDIERARRELAEAIAAEEWARQYWLEHNTTLNKELNVDVEDLNQFHVYEWFAENPSINDAIDNQLKNSKITGNNIEYYKTFGRRVALCTIKYKLILNGVINNDIAYDDTKFQAAFYRRNYLDNHYCIRYYDLKGVYHEEYYDDISHDIDGKSMYRNEATMSTDHDNPSLVYGSNCIKKLPDYNFNSTKDAAWTNNQTGQKINLLNPETNQVTKTYARNEKSVNKGFEEVNGTIKGYDWYLGYQLLSDMSEVTIEGDGGAIWLDGSITAYDTLFTGSRAGNGAALAIVTEDNATVTLEYTSIVNSTATENGGGIYIKSDNVTLVTFNTTIARNTAMNGAGIYIDGGEADVKMIDTTLAGNIASTAGGGIYSNADATTMTFLNSVLYANYNKTIGDSGQDDILFKADAEYELNAAYSVYGAYNAYNGTEFAELQATNAIGFVQQDVANDNVSNAYAYTETVDGFVVPKLGEYTEDGELLDNQNQYTVAITYTGMPALKGTLTGKLDGDYYFYNKEQGIWESFTNKEAQYAFDASQESYGLPNDTENGVVFDDAQNYDEDGRVSRVATSLTVFNAGAYALNMPTPEPEPTPEPVTVQTEEPVEYAQDLNNIKEQNITLSTDVQLMTNDVYLSIPYLRDPEPEYVNDSIPDKLRPILPPGEVLFDDHLIGSMIVSSNLSKGYALISGKELYSEERNYSTIMVYDNDLSPVSQQLSSQTSPTMPRDFSIDNTEVYLNALAQEEDELRKNMNSLAQEDNAEQEDIDEVQDTLISVDSSNETDMTIASTRVTSSQFLKLVDSKQVKHDARYEIDTQHPMPEHEIVKILSMPNKARKFQSNYERILSDLQTTIM
jgi:predicted outer membrane repeat protein